VPLSPALAVATREAVRDDLNFAGARTAYASHAMHSFSAKFPPQLARWGIERFSEPGETILDPMLGSGTTMVEARLRGRSCLGTDIDPLSRLIARVKSTPLDPDELASVDASTRARVRLALGTLRAARSRGARLADVFPNVTIPVFPNRDYWFLPQVVEEMALLRSCLDHVASRPLRDFFYLVFSSMIITKSSTSVANVRDLAHSRPHFALARREPDVLATFESRLTRLGRAIADFSRAAETNVQTEVIGNDARSLPLADASIDLVFTSPPYVNAIDYPRAHKFSLHWLGDVLDVSPDQYRDLGRRYIGTDRVAAADCARRAVEPLGCPEADETIARLAEVDVRRAGVAHQYFADMGQVISEAARVLRPGRVAVVVVAPSTIGQVHVATERILAAQGEQRGLRTIAILQRTLDERKRQLPVMRGRFGVGMQTEHLIVLRKE
jgi:DNA modification methylase